ncbi:MAG: glycine cleavage system protein H [Elusimicrobia bacterium RIFOXYB2_FULL_49_7]|nr:MAG: glycine cleavage system protein H [Elusimicrobia bacterium RIFOXYB2_FULL_49_7]
MSNIPQELKYTKDHEWAKVEGKTALVGITDHAQHELGDIIYVELPQVGAEVTKGAQFGEIEAVKTVAPLNAPLSGKVVEVNNVLADNAGVINSDAYAAGWIIKVELSHPEEAASLLSADQYQELL